jgi:hypothetical protein
LSSHIEEMGKHAEPAHGDPAHDVVDPTFREQTSDPGDPAQADPASGQFKRVFQTVNLPCIDAFPVSCGAGGRLDEVVGGADVEQMSEILSPATVQATGASDMFVLSSPGAARSRPARAVTLVRTI